MALDASVRTDGIEGESTGLQAQWVEWEWRAHWSRQLLKSQVSGL
jgi:hypothetical protein